MAKRTLPYRLFAPGLLLLACSGSTATDEDVKAAVMVYAQSLASEISALLTALDSAAAFRAAGLSISTCPEGTANGCTTWCPESSEIVKVCESSAAVPKACDTTNYKVSGTKIYLKSDVSDLTRAAGVYTGIITVTYDFNGSYTGATDPAARRLKCRADVQIGIDVSQIVSRTVDCQQFTCSLGGSTIGCDAFQYALDSQSCGSPSGGGGGGGGGGGETPTSVGSCTQTSTGRCQDFTGSLWTAEVVQDHCSSASGTYSADECTTTSRVGSCTLSAGNPDEIILRFYPPDDASTGAAACAGSSGTWVAD